MNNELKNYDVELGGKVLVTLALYIDDENEMRREFEKIVMWYKRSKPGDDWSDIFNNIVKRHLKVRIDAE